MYMYVFHIACKLDSHSTVIHLSWGPLESERRRVEDKGDILAQEEGERRKCVLRIS